MPTTTEGTLFEAIQGILKATNDGDDLSPGHLYMLECGCNGLLNDAGVKTVMNLWDIIQTQGYTKPWLDDVENLTMDHEGYVYWKGTQVEHFSYRNAQARAKASRELGDRCNALEKKGFPVNSSTVIWKWDIFKEMRANEPTAMTLLNTYSFMCAQDQSIVVIMKDRTAVWMPIEPTLGVHGLWIKGWFGVDTLDTYRYYQSKNYIPPNLGQNTGDQYPNGSRDTAFNGDPKQVVKYFRKYIPADLHKMDLGTIEQKSGQTSGLLM